MSRLSPIKDLLHSLAALAKDAAFFCFATGFITLAPSHLTAQEKQGSETSPARQYFSQPHLGTLVQIAFYSDNKDLSQKLANHSFKRIEKLNKIFSDYLSDSEVSQLCAKPAKVAHRVSEDLFTVIAQAQEISIATDGAFDITLGHSTQKWRESARQKKLVQKDEIQTSYKDLILDSKTKTILLRQPLKIDLGGIAKGYIADQVMLILRKAGIKQAAVIIGGEMLFTEAPPGKVGWTVRIEQPSREILGALTIHNTALSTSGDSYQFFEQDHVRHSHLIDPSNGKSKTDRLNVTTLAQSAILADAWATALRVSLRKSAFELANETTDIEAAFIPFGKAPTFTQGFPKLQ